MENYFGNLAQYEIFSNFVSAILGTTGVGGTRLAFSAIIWEPSTWLIPFFRQMIAKKLLFQFIPGTTSSVLPLRKKKKCLSLYWPALVSSSLAKALFSIFVSAILGTAGVGGIRLAFSAIIWEPSTWLIPFLRQMIAKKLLFQFIPGTTSSVSPLRKKKKCLSL